MKALASRCGALFALAAALAACDRSSQQAAPAPTASAPVAAPAPAPTGPVIQPVALARPTDAQRAEGATLATQGGGGAVAACASCHGAQGEGNAAAGFPRIAGQPYTYLLHELESYAGGTRKHPVMQPIAAAMTAQQRVAAAAHYASLVPAGTAAAGAGTPAVAAPAPAPPAGGNAARGRQLADAGDEALGVQACANCHGPGGIGAGELYPYLAGQHVGYLAATLAAWRDGARNNDPSGQMPVIARALSPQDLQAVAAYYAAQPLRSTPLGTEPLPVVASQSPAVQSGPQPGAGGGSASGAATSGGIDQGPGLTGGSQGPGGGGATSAPSTGAPQGTTAPVPAASR